MIRRRRSAMTILEVLISMVLTMAAMTMLLYFYNAVDGINRSIERVQEESFRSRYFEGRLAAILPRIIGETDQSKDFLFTMTDGKPGLTKAGMPTLLFMYDNGVDLNPDFSNHVLGRLYISEKGNLMFAMWPAPDRWRSDQPVPMRKELLLEQVETLAFQFYIPSNEGEEKGGWVEEWTLENKKLPALIGVRVKVKDETREYLFPLSNRKGVIRIER